MICCLVALTLHSAHPRQVAFNVQQMLTAYARDVRGAMKPRLHSDLNRDSGYKTVEPNDDIIEERLPGRARRGTEAAPMETRGLDPVPETQSEQDDPSIMTGDEEMPFGCTPTPYTGTSMRLCYITLGTGYWSKTRIWSYCRSATYYALIGKNLLQEAPGI